MFQQAAKEIAKDKDLIGEDLRVLHLLYGYLDIKNYISISQIDIANELNMQKQNVNRSINALLKKGIVLKGPRVGKSWTYILNANYGYKGKLKYLKGERKRHLALVEDQEIEREVMQKTKKQSKKNDKLNKIDITEENQTTLF